MRVGIADHLGWAVAVTASADGSVVDRRRIDLIEPGVATAPIEHEVQGLSDRAAVGLVAKVRGSIAEAAGASLDELSRDLPSSVVSISLRAWPEDFPTDIAVLRRAPYQSRADAVMYRQELAELAHERGWDVHFYDAKSVASLAVDLLAARSDEILERPRATLGPPWTKDHRVAFAAAIVANRTDR